MLPDLRFDIVANDETQLAFDQVRTSGQRAMREIETGGAVADRSLRANRASVANLSFQLNDITQGLLTGQSPFQIMIQQGSQVAQVFSQSGAKGVGGALGLLKGALTSLINPTTLMTFAVIGLGGAFLSWIGNVLRGSDDIEEVLKTQAGLVKDIEAAYKDAALGVTDYSRESLDVLQAQLRASNILIERSLQGMSEAIIRQTGSIGLQGLIPHEEFAIFNSSLQFFYASIRQGNPDVITFRQEIAQAMNMFADNEAIQVAGNRLLEMSRQAGGAAQSLLKGALALQGFGAAAEAEADRVDAFTAALDRMNGAFRAPPTEMQRTMADLSEAMRVAATSGERVNAVLAFGAAVGRHYRDVVSSFVGAWGDAATAAGNAGGSGSAAAKRQTDAAEELIQALTAERELLQMSAVDQEVANNLRKAGAEATDEQIAEIEALTRALYEEKEALDAIRRAGDFLESVLSSAFDRLIVQGDDWRDVLSDVLRMLASAILQAALFGSGGLGGLGIFGGGLFPTLMPGLFGGNAVGGPMAPGQTKLVGERGPELLRIGHAGQVTPLDQLGGGVTLVYAPVIHAASGVTRQEVAIALRENNKALRMALPGMVRDAGRRNRI